MSTFARCVVAVSVVLWLAGGVLADWDNGMSYKMHHPQFPDPDGWDVRISEPRRDPADPHQVILADDWRCNETGYVSDVHLWVSYMQDVEDDIVNLHLSIHHDIPASHSQWGYSMPEDVAVWERDFRPGEFTVRYAGDGLQGWYDAFHDDWWDNDHWVYYQINVVDIPDPFIQEKDQIYWLDVSVDLWGESETGKLGWKTSLDHYNDAAVYWDVMAGRWQKLEDPLTGDVIDLAFVITGHPVPEPATAALMVLGAGALLTRRRRRR